MDNRKIKRSAAGRWTAALLAALLCCLTLGGIAAADVKGNSFDVFQYELVEGGVAITGYTGEATAVTIPDSIEGAPVVAIGEGAFLWNRQITQVTLPESITTIGEQAFYYCTALTSAALPSGVTSIGDFAFTHCEKLLGVQLPAALTTIGNHAFQWCTTLSQLTLPAGVRSVGEYAFYGCTGLPAIQVDAANADYTARDGVLFDKQVSTLLVYPAGKPDATYTLPATVATVVEAAFAHCAALVDVTLPASVTSLGTNTFCGCTGLTRVTLSPALTALPSNTFQDCAALADVTLPQGVASIGASAFWGCSSLTTLALPQALASIGTDAFRNCTALLQLNIPAATREILPYAFYGCSGLRALEVASANTSYRSQDGVLFSADGGTLLAYPGGKTATAYTLPAGSVSIADGAFSGCTHLAKLTLPEGVADIGSNNFVDCPALVDVALPSTLTFIPRNGFVNCTALQSITLPAGCTTLRNGSFAGCTALQSITLPAGCTTVGYDTFAGCTALSAATLPASVTTILEGAFADCPRLTIFGETGSRAQSYARSNGIPFALIGTATHTVTFLDFDSSVLAEQTVAHGGNATPPASPFRASYTFTGWQPEYTNVTGDLTVTAQYQPRLLGDVDGNGVLEAYDALLALRIAVGALQPTPEQLWSACTTGDAVTAYDALVILKWSVA